MKRPGYYLSYFLKIGTLVSTSALVLSVLVQIYGRFFLDNTPPWTEEASRLFFIYAVAFAAGLAYKQQYFVFLDLISGKLGPKSDRLLEVSVNILVFMLFLTIAVFSLLYIRMGLSENSPSLGFNMSIGFASILLMAASICFFSGVKILRLLKKMTW
jgi:TRAP-type C4-dicarboxylate transport system permease small subunit